MAKQQGWGRALLAGMFMWLLVAPAWAQNTPEDEYKDLIRVSQDIQPLGEHPFGESISLYDGSLSFEQTDASLAGNGPLLQFTRNFAVDGSSVYDARAAYAFGDWEIALPRIETMTGNGYFGHQHITGWEVNTAGDFNDRCTDFNKPLPLVAHPNDPALTPWDPALWWKGYHLIVPGQGSEDLLENDGTDQATYPAVTKNHWRVSCLASTVNGQPGEAFLAEAPDGTKYWFNELVYRWAPELTRTLYDGGLGSAQPIRSFDALFASQREFLGDLLGWLTGSAPAQATPIQDFLLRQNAWMLVTKIEDRFGNTLIYSYDSTGHLTGITASDGRQLTVQYLSGTTVIHSVTLQPAAGAPRVWTYGYSGIPPYQRTLSSVTLPDGTAWGFDLADFNTASLDPVGGPDSCVTLRGRSTTVTVGSITHPSGLTGTFSIKPVKHGRSHVPRDCRGMENNLEDTPGSYATRPDAWYGFTVVQKALSGAGLPTETWHYNYSAANDNWSDCTGSCPTTVYTDVVNPDGSTTRHTFSNYFDATESHLQRTDDYSGAAGIGLMRSQVNIYTALGGGCPTVVGYNLQDRINSAQTQELRPQSKRVLTQDGNTYTWQAETFNCYGQVTQATRYNSIAGQSTIEEQMTYLNDTTLWVLGLPLMTTNVSDGNTVVSQNVYDMTLDTPKERWRFGQKLMSYTFNSSGQLATFKDGNNHTTTLSNYKRGIPQTIAFPDSHSQTLAVDDFGQITAITDQASKTTSYHYDAVGRLTQITYPADTVAWYPKSISYSFVTTVQNGIGANHWQRRVSQGNYRQITYFDALLRPLLLDTYVYGDSSSYRFNRTVYDWKGQATFQSYPSGGSYTTPVDAFTEGTHTTYDALGRVLQTVQDSEQGNLTTSTAYLSGARQQVTDPKGKVTTISYQVFDQPGGDAVIRVEAPASVTQTIVRDLYGNPTSITQSGTYSGGSVSVTKNLYYDDYKRLCRTTEPESGSEVVDYDAANNLAWSASGLAITGTDCGREQVAAGSRTTRSYDAMNRVLAVNYPSGTTDTAFTYDSRGAMAIATAGTAAWTYAYNARGLLTGETLAIDSHTWPLVYTYDRYGTVGTVTWPDNRAIAYAPDAMGRATQAGAYASGVDYFPDGSIEAFGFGSGATFLAEQNTRHLVANLTYAKGATLAFSQDYTYDKNANLTAVTDLAGGTRSKALTYDDLNRLTQATAAGLWGTATYSYDPLNNIRSLNSDGVSRTYAYDTTNRLTAITSGSTTLHSFVYDARGNTTQKDSQVRVFDAANRLTQVTGSATYAYDAAGRRVKATDAGGAVTYWMYSQAGQLMMQYVPTPAKTTDYIHLGGQLIAEVAHTTSDTVTYTYTDALGSPSVRTNVSGTGLVLYDYRPYGLQQGGPSNTGPGFTGHVNDPGTGLVYMQQRYYDPEVGRPQSVDPIGPDAGDVFNFNRYAYANNNPIRYTDPDGRCPWCFGALIGGALELGIQLATPEGRAAYAEAGKALAHGDFSGALNAAGSEIAKVGASAAAGAAGVGIAGKIAEVANIASKGMEVSVGAKIVANTAIKVAGNSAAGAGLGAAAKVAGNAASGQPLTQGVGMAAVAGGIGGAAGSSAEIAINGGAQALADGTGNFIGSSSGIAAPGLTSAAGQRLGATAGAVAEKATTCTQSGDVGC